jgi:CheY-like chemotaxis protein
MRSEEAVDSETGNFICDQEYCDAHPGFAPGQYVRLAVSDDGRGMDKETMGHLFEPFFTTKEQGKGTGLGLATVYGIVKQNSGFVDVHSQPGQGSTFTVYLPRASESEAEAEVQTAEETSPSRGTETVLVVEDEEAIRELTRENLQSLGYGVLTAGRPRRRCGKVQAHTGPLQLVIHGWCDAADEWAAALQRLAAMRPG